MRRRPQRVPGWARVMLALLLGMTAGVAVLVTLVAVRGGPAQGRMAPVAAPAAPAVASSVVRDPPVDRPDPMVVQAREVLHRWDAARARAWRTGDRVALARLYAAGSVAGRRDVAALAAWQGRGLRVLRLDTQVLGLRVLSVDDGRLVLRVTDRVARLEVEGLAESGGGGGPGVLPRDGPSTRRLVLLREPGRAAGAWRVASVLDV